MRVAVLMTSLGLVAACGGTTPASAVEIAVAVDGDDRGPGSLEAPFQTLERAQHAVRERVAAGLDEQVSVVVRGGTYRVAEPLVFGVGDGGTAAHAIVWKAHEGERVTLSGGRPIEGWMADSDGLWHAPVPRDMPYQLQFRELFVNGERRTRARHPNGTFARVGSAGPDRRTSFVTAPGSFPPLTPGSDAELVFLHDWSISRIPVQSVDPATGRIALAANVGATLDQFAIDHFEPHPRFFLENDPAYLDEEGEWLLDLPVGRVVYRPYRGESLDDVEIIAPQATALVVVRGDEASGTPVRNLHFVGFEFEHAAWPLPAGGYAGVQAGFYDVRTPAGATRSQGPAPAAVSFQIAESCSVMDGAVRHVGGSGIEFGSRCRNCALARMVLRDISVNGVVIGESDTRAFGGGAWVDTAPEQVALGNVVEDCLIERCGEQFYGGVGIWVGLTAATTIRHNIVRDLPYTGISIGWRWNPSPTPARENRILNNHIYDVVQLLSDGGGIYTLGAQPGTHVAHNLIHSIPAGVGRAESDGIFVDEGTTGLTFQGNTIFDTANPPLRFHRAGGNLVTGNTLVVPNGVPHVRYANMPETNITMQNNAVVPQDRFRAPDPAKVGAGPVPDIRRQLEARR